MDAHEVVEWKVPAVRAISIASIRDCAVDLPRHMDVQVGGVAHEPAAPEIVHIAVALKSVGNTFGSDPIQTTAGL